MTYNHLRITFTPFLISSLLLFICFVISFIFLSRAFMLGSLAGITFLLIAYKKIIINIKNIFIVSLLLIFSLLFLSVLIKSDSSLGRLLIYKISYNMFIENPLTGIGLDNFKREYGLYQALYFKMGNYTTKEFLLAGNGYYAFNDYWQFIVETGLIGGSVLIILFYLIIKIICLRIKNYPNDICLILSTSILITICTAALFTHVFAHKAFIIISSFTLFYIVFPIKSLAIKNSFKFLAALLAIFVFSITQYYQEIKNYRYLKNLDEANLLSETGYILRSQEMYADLYPKMKNDVGFLRQYADLLTGEDNLSEKLRILSEIQNQWTDNLLYMKLGRVHEELEHYKKAEAAYLQAVYIVPNRFVTREALYNFYIRINQHKKANYWRKSILLMPIKIPSKRVEQIRNNVRKQKS